MCLTTLSELRCEATELSNFCHCRRTDAYGIIRIKQTFKVMVKASDITVDDERDYVTATSPDDMELPLESAGRLDLLHSGGHLLIECSDGDLTGVWYSADSVPSEQSDYEELFP